MTDRISTYATSASLTNQALKLQSRFATTQQQQSSGLKSEHYDGIARDSKRLLNLQSQFDAITANVTSISAAQSRLTAMQNAMDGIQDLFTSVLAQFSQAQAGGYTEASSAITAAQSQAWRDELVSLLNTQYGGSYLFGGGAKDTAPVNLSAAGYDPNDLSVYPDYGYYQGDDVTDSVRASQTLRIDYGVTAENSAFEKAIRALSTAIVNPADPEILARAQALIKEASNEVADISGILTGKASILEKESQMHAATLDYLDSAISDLRNVDMASTTLQLTQLETQLEASYATLSKLLSLKLSDYL